MHLIMIALALIWASGSRLTTMQQRHTWQGRWHHALKHLLFPPLLLGMTSLAILCMGPQGEMVWGLEGWLSYGLAWGFVGWAIGRLGLLFWQGWQTIELVDTYPVADYQGQTLRLLPLSQLYSAQVGFWQPQLVVSDGLLTQLTPEHLAAVLWHEQAHYHYRDTFWFFWLGWARHLTGWLPYSHSLWQELLLLREIRADRWAGQYTDKLLLAEALLQMVAKANGMLADSNVVTAFTTILPTSHLLERIEALCNELEHDERPLTQPLTWQPWPWVWLICICWPLIAIPLHHSH